MYFSLFYKPGKTNGFEDPIQISEHDWHQLFPNRKRWCRVKIGTRWSIVDHEIAESQPANPFYEPLKAYWKYYYDMVVREVFEKKKFWLKIIVKVQKSFLGENIFLKKFSKKFTHFFFLTEKYLHILDVFVQHKLISLDF